MNIVGQMVFEAGLADSPGDLMVVRGMHYVTFHFFVVDPKCFAISAAKHCSAEVALSESLVVFLRTTQRKKDDVSEMQTLRQALAEHSSRL